jgi:phage FluMu protein Com
MAIEFRCSQCNQLLRVPETSGGKNARCPKCQALMQVPMPAGGAGFAAPPPPPPLGGGFSPQGARGFSEQAPPPAAGNDPFNFMNQGGGGGGGAPPPPKNPFGDTGGGATPFGGAAGGVAVNPYASPASAAYQPAAFGPIAGSPVVPRPVGVEPILNYAWQLWQQHLGILLGITVIGIAVNYAIQIVFTIPQMALQANDQAEAAIAVSLLGSLLNQGIQLFLGIGMARIALKLARRQRAEFTDLFSGGPLFLPVLGAYILFNVALTVGLLLLIVPGIILALMLWPYYMLIVDQKAGVIESFSLASQVTKNNWGTAFLLAILSIGIFIVGVIALCIGVIFAVPLILMLWTVAYLMMSGQIPVQPAYAQYGAQPVPQKW